MLYIIATPIGNLDDISFRALKILKEVDKIAAEDTRHSGQLLHHFNISKPLIALHDHNEQAQTNRFIEYLKAGEKIAIISDAGTPLISDPGFKLVRAAHEHNIKVIPIPGPCALITALCASGIPTDSFVFEGFLPAKSAARQAHLKTLIDEPRTLIFYESPHRILSTLADLGEILGAARKATLARELTKTFETIQYGELNQLIDFVKHDLNQQKGEMVIVVAGLTKAIKDTTAKLSPDVTKTLVILLKELPLKQAANLAAQITGARKKILYDYGLALLNK